MMNCLYKKLRAVSMTLSSDIIKTVNGYPTEIADAKGGAAVDYTVYGNVGAAGKNLIPYPYYNTTKTKNGITFTDNGDGSVTVNGTATAKSYFYMAARRNDIDTTKRYVLSGSTPDVCVYVSLSLNDVWKKDIYSRGKPVIVDFPSYTNIEYNQVGISLYVLNGTTVDTVTIRPQLELGESATEYEPYKVGFVGDKTDNLIDEDTVLTAQGWVKQADGGYYAENGKTVYQKKIWENTEGYTGQLRVSCLFRYAKSKAEVGDEGVFLTVSYTDGTTSDVLPQASNTDADTWLPPNENQTLTSASKTVSDICWNCGTDNNSTWVKNIFVSKNTAAEKYEPYGYKIPISVSADKSDSETAQTTIIYIPKQLKPGESINYKADLLPDLILNEGYNSITAETKVSPSSIGIRYLSKQAD